MNKLKAILLRVGLMPLLATTLYACGSDTLPSPTPAPAIPPTIAPSQTPTLTSESFNITPSTDDATSLFGLPAGAFRNSRTQAFQPALPQQGRFENTNLPVAAKLGAPGWVKPGMRITFYGAAATVASSAEPNCIKDPNGKWDGDDGEKYTCTGMPDDPAGSSSGNTSGDALSQIDVLAVEGTDVVLATTLFSIDHINNQYVIAPSGGGKAPGDVIEGVWIHPTRLAEIAKTKIDGVKILKGDFTVEGVTYQSVKFVSSRTGSYESYTYDTKTGLLIETITRTVLAGATGKTQLYIRRLQGYRQLNVPGMKGANPAWVAGAKQLNYKGSWNFANPMGGDSEPMVYPMTATVTLNKGGKNWTPFTAKSAIDFSSYKQESTGSGVTGSSGQYWIDPKALTALKKGQVLDEDPHTKEMLVVDSVVNSGATKTVAISSELPGNKTLFTYDRTTGALVDFQTSSSGMGITILLRLQNVPR